MTFEEYTRKKLKQNQSGAGLTFEEYTNSLLGSPTQTSPSVDIAPVVETAPTKEDDTWFKGSGVFDDGWDFGDITKTILGTTGDIVMSAVQGVANMGEGLLDLGMYGVAGVADLFGADEFAEEVRKDAQENTVDTRTSIIKEGLGIENASVLGNKADGVFQGLGQIGGMYATAGLGSLAGLGSVGSGIATMGAMGASSMGSGISEAYQGGATDGEAFAYGAMSGAIDTITEMIFGGLGKAVNVIGISRGISSLDDMFAKKLSSKISNQFAKNAVEAGVKASAEGAEEWIAGASSAIAKKLSYMSDEDLSQLIKDEHLLDQFVTGTLSSGFTQVGGLYKSTTQGRDFITNFSGNEEKVIEKEFENRVAKAEQNGTKLTNKEKTKLYEQVQNDMRKGYISTDTIESVLGGETYKNYKDTVDSEDSILKEFDELGKKQNATLAEQTRYTELQEKVKEIKSNSNRNNLKSKLSQEVYNSVKEKDVYLAESYNERARRGQAFEADLSEYDDKTAETVKKAIDSGILNNTRRTHEFVDMVAKISADKGVLFDFTNNAKLKESGFEVEEGVTRNGFISKDGVTINVQSAKVLNTVVGHEITHSFEKAKSYDKLQEAVFEYAKLKGEYDSRLASITKMYKKYAPDADPKAELTADLVGDYLFTDADFINNLSTKHRNVFQKIYDEIKYLLKIATTGSKEARDLEKAKRAFEKAYRASGKTSGDTKYSLSTDSDGKKLTNEQSEYFKDSKMRDENGNLKVMYHGSQDAGFHEFNAKFSDDDTSFFFVDSNDVAASYSGTSETYEAQTIHTAEDMNNFIESIGAEGYEVVEKDGKFTLLYEGDRVADSDTAKGIYEEFCWYEGVGDGDVNYKVYLNLTNPLEVDAKGRPWNKIDAEFSQEVYDKYQSLTAEEKAALSDLAEWEDFRIFNSEIQEAQGNALASAYAKMGEDCNIYDLFSVATDNFSEESLRENARKYLKTRDYAQRAKAEGYDGVIFKNIVDNGGFSNGSEGASTVAIAFDSNQIKSVANEKPTSNPDIRYSLSPQTDKDYLDAVERGDAETLAKMVSEAAEKAMPNSKVRDENGNLRLVYHGRVSDFNVFDRKFSQIESDFGKGYYFTSNEFDVDENYASEEGPDLRNKIARYAERLEYEEGYEELSYEEREQIARDKFITSEPNTVTAYLNMENPVYITPNENGTFLDFEEAYDEEFDEYGEPEGLFVDFIEALNNNAADYLAYGNVDFSFLYEHVYDNGGMYAADAVQAIKNNDSFIDALMDENGDLALNEVIRLAFEDIGFDGIIDSSVYYKFRNMNGMDSGTTHYIAFNSNQIKSADLTTYDDNGNVIPLSERFKSDNNDIRYSLSAEGETPKRYGTYNIFGDDIRLEAPTQEETTVSKMEQVAPIQEDIAKNATTTKNVAPITEDTEEKPIAQTEKAAAPKERTPSNAALANFTKKSKYSGGFNFQGGYSAGGKQYLSDGNFAAELNDVDESIPHNKDFPIKKLQNSLSEAVSAQSSEKYTIDFDKIVEINRANKNGAIVSVGGTLFDGEYIEAVMRAIPDSTFALSNYRGGLKPLVAVGNNGTAMIMPLRAGDNVTVNYEAQEAKSSLDFAPMPSEPTIYDLEQEQAELEKVIPQAMESNDPSAPELVSQYTELLDRIAKLKAEESAMDRERLASLDDVDAPPEAENDNITAPYENDNVTSIDDTTIQEIAQKVQSVLYIEDKNMGSLKDIIRNYGESTREELYNAIDAEFGTIYEAGEVDPELLEIKKYLRNTPIKLNASNKAELRYFNDGKLGNVLKSNFGKLRISNKGSGVDSVYQELNELYPDYFPSDIEQEHEQRHRIFNVANMDSKPTDVPVARIEPEILEEATDLIINGINEYRLNSNAELADNIRIEQFDSLIQDAEDIAPIAPIAESKTVQNPRIDTAIEDIGPVAESTKKAEAYEAIKPKKESAEPKLKRVKEGDSRPGEKERKWIGTSTESEAVDGKILPEDLDQEAIHYQPISNKKTLNTANAKLNGMGYEASVAYFNSQFANRKTTVEDVVLGERLIQEAIKRGDTKTAGELIEDVAILGTELGQKVQALSIIKRLTPEGQLRMLQRTVERGKTRGDKAFEGVEITQEMIDKILEVYGKDGTFDQTKLNKAVEDVKQKIADQMKVTKMDKINAWRYLSMLGNPKTHIRNLVSNVAMRGTTAVKNVFARTIETVAPIENRTKTWKKASSEVKEFSQKTAAEMKDVLKDGGKYDEDASIKQKRAVFKNKILNGVYEFNSDMLTKEDWWFSRPAFTNALSEYLTANGIRTEQDIQNNPKIVAKAKQYATEQSQIATFRQYSWLANKINEIEHRNVATQIGVGAVLPFKKTPINIAKTALNYSPLGFAKTLTYDASQVKNGNMEASTLVDHLAQNLTGSAIVLIGYMLAQSGFINGAGEDDKEGDYDYQLGEQAYSINIGDSTYSLSWLSPIAMPLFVGANAYERLVEKEEWNGDVVVETLAQTLDPLSEMSFLSSLDSVLSSYDNGVEKFAGIAGSAAQSYITQFAPTLSSQIAAVMDDTKRSTKVAADSDFKFVDETVNKLKYKIPFLRETLEPSTDIWGNEIKQTENIMARAIETFIAPYAEKSNISSGVDDELKALYRETGDAGLIPSIPHNYINYNDEKYEMSASEYTEYKKLYGQNAYELMSDLFDTNTYKNASSEERADMVNRVYDYARDEAKREYFAKYGVDFTNATKDGEEYYKENSIKGAIEYDVTPDEYEFSVENPEKYKFLHDVGVTYEEFDNGSEEFKEAYSWAFNNPEKYTMSKAVASDVVTYRKYTSDLYDIKADKDEDGKSISGSRKEKVAEYINNLNADYGEKIILFKSEYNADDTYNYDIIDYLNNREDISYEEMVTILKELGFTVGSDGTVYWD